jgi:hypothetical protein
MIIGRRNQVHSFVGKYIKVLGVCTTNIFFKECCLDDTFDQEKNAILPVEKF